MDATISAHLASILAARQAGRRLRTSQCIRIAASPDLVRPGYYEGDQLWTAIRLTPPGMQFDLKIRLVTTHQHLGGERRWFVCPRCGRGVGCLYAAWINEPFWCRRCHGLLYDSQFVRRDDNIRLINAFLGLERALQRVERRRARQGMHGLPPLIDPYRTRTRRQRRRSGGPRQPPPTDS